MVGRVSFEAIVNMGTLTSFILMVELLMKLISWNDHQFYSHHHFNTTKINLCGGAFPLLPLAILNYCTLLVSQSGTIYSMQIIIDTWAGDTDTSELNSHRHYQPQTITGNCFFFILVLLFYTLLALWGLRLAGCCCLGYKEESRPGHGNK